MPNEPISPEPPTERERAERRLAEWHTDETACWLCGTPLIKRHCKLICPHCGFMRDCSDP